MNTQNTIETIQSSTCKSMRDDINDALQAIQDKYGVSAEVKGTVSYNADTATFKVEVSVIRDGQVITKEQKFLNERWKLLGIKDERMLRTMLRCPKGKFYYLQGYKQRAYKRPFIIEDAITGNKYMTSAKHVESMTLADDKV